MSQGSKITLLASLAVTTTIIGYVHFKQSDDTRRLHQGVIRDMERQRHRQEERQDNLLVDDKETTTNSLLPNLTEHQPK